MLVGAQPWQVPDKTDKSFNAIMNGQIEMLLQSWESSHFIDKESLGMYICMQMSVVLCVQYLLYTTGLVQLDADIKLSLSSMQNFI